MWGSLTLAWSCKHIPQDYSYQPWDFGFFIVGSFKLSCLFLQARLANPSTEHFLAQSIFQHRAFSSHADQTNPCVVNFKLVWFVSLVTGWGPPKVSRVSVLLENWPHPAFCWQKHFSIQFFFAMKCDGHMTADELLFQCPFKMVQPKLMQRITERHTHFLWGILSCCNRNQNLLTGSRWNL